MAEPFPDEPYWPSMEERGAYDQDYSDQMHRENDPHYIKDSDIFDPTDRDDDDEYEMQIECDACNGDGWQRCDGIKIPCAECGGSGWC